MPFLIGAGFGEFFRRVHHWVTDGGVIPMYKRLIVKRTSGLLGLKQVSIPNGLPFGKADWPPELMRGAMRRLS